MNKSATLEHKWSLLLSLGLALSIVLIVFNYDPRATGQDVVSTLAVAQAGIFAIVFSVVVLGVQLSTSQYAPRLATDFVADDSYKSTVTIFGLSIGMDIAVLAIFGQLPDYILILLLAISFLVAVGSFITLYEFVSETLKKTTPEGILVHLQERMTLGSMLTDIEQSGESPSNPDPFLPLVSVINSFISNKDRSSASLGLNVLGDRASTLAVCEEFLYIEEGSPLDESVENLCSTHIPNITEEAVEHDLMQIAIENSDTVQTIGEATIENGSDKGFDHLINGHIQLIDTLGFEPDEERIRSDVIDTSTNLIKSSANNGLWNSAAIGTRRLGWITATSIMMRDQEDGSNRQYTSLLILGFPKVLKIATGSYSTFQDHSTGEWLRLQRLDSQPTARLINSCYGSMAEVTSAAIRYEMRTEQQIVEWDSVAYGWSEGLGTLGDSNLDEMKQLWLGTLLYLEYLEENTPDHVMNGFNPRSHYQISEEIGSKTVDQIQHGRLDPSSPIELRPGRADPVETPLTGYRVSILADTDESFEEWVSGRNHLFNRGLFGRSVDFRE